MLFLLSIGIFSLDKVILIYFILQSIQQPAGLVVLDDVHSLESFSFNQLSWQKIYQSIFAESCHSLTAARDTFSAFTGRGEYSKKYVK